MTQSNPNNGSAVQRIKINLQIHTRAEGGDVFIGKKIVFCSWHSSSPGPSKVSPSPWPRGGRIVGLPRDFKVTVIIGASGIKNKIRLSMVRNSFGHWNSHILLDEVTETYSCILPPIQCIYESPGDLKMQIPIQWVWGGAQILHCNKVSAEPCAVFLGWHFGEQEFTKRGLWSKVTY